MSWSEKKAYLQSFVIIKPTARARDRKNDGESRMIYFLGKNQDKVRVCKTMFLNTYGVGEKAIKNWKNNTMTTHNDEENEPNEDQELQNEVNNDQILTKGAGINYKKYQRVGNKSSLNLKIA